MERRDAVLGLCSYFVLAAIAMHPFISLPSPYRFIFDINFVVWSFEFSFCWFVVYYLYKNGPKDEPQLFRMGIWLVLHAAVLMVSSKTLIANTSQFIEHAPVVQKVALESIVSGFEVLQNIISFGLAALGATLSGTVIIDRWKAKSAHTSPL